jgi:Concanavalin A-like lectin/glucanases superfamily
MSVVGLLPGCGKLLGIDDFQTALPGDAGNDAPTVGASAYVETVLADSPLAYYRLEESGLGPAADASGAGQDGVYKVFPGVSGTGALTFGETGALADPTNRAVRIYGLGNFEPDGITDDESSAHVETDNTTVSPWAGDFTIEGWLLPYDAPPTWDNLFYVAEEYDGGQVGLGGGFRLGWRRSSFLPVAWSNEGGGTSVQVGTIPLIAESWNHLVFSYTKADATMSIYVNGELSAAGPFEFLPPTAVANFGFGAKQGTPSSGVFDELAIYGIALSPARLAEHIAAAKR